MSNFPTIYVISDSVGATASTVAQAAVAQFGVKNPNIQVLAKVKEFIIAKNFLEERLADLADNENQPYDSIIVFYTLVDPEIRDELSAYIESNEKIVGVDLLTSAINAISQMTGIAPESYPGALRVLDVNYFNRVEAIRFTIAHDDGRNPQNLSEADIVLIGVSRSCKTPISIYLAQQGYRVANIPLDLETAPPKELDEIDKTRLFGLMTSPEVLQKVRLRRLPHLGSVAQKYTDLEYIFEDLAKAHEVMRSYGSIVIRTDDRAIEEAAQEILSYYLKNHEAPNGDII